MGKASTSVGPSLPRKRLCRSLMACSSTNRTLSSASPRTSSAARTASASRDQRRMSTGCAVCSLATNTSTLMVGTLDRSGDLGVPRPRALLLDGLVGGDDVSHDAVADDIAGRQVHEGEAVDAGEDLLEP